MHALYGFQPKKESVVAPGVFGMLTGMYLIHVYPLLKGVAPHSLTYASKERYPVGSCVNVPIRSKTVCGVVHTVEPVHAARARIRAATHTITTIKKQLATHPLPQGLIHAIEHEAHLSAVAPGAVLTTYTPDTLRTTPLQKRDAAQKKNAHLPDIRVSQATTQELQEALVRAARETLARGMSLIIVSPEAHLSDAYFSLCSTVLGTERCQVLHGSMTPAAQRKIVSYIRTAKHPTVLCITPFFLGVLPPARIGTCIVTDESSPHYHTMHRPHIDTKRITETYATYSGIPCLFQDILLSAPLQARIAEGTVTTQEPYREIIRSTARTHLESLTTEKGCPALCKNTRAHIQAAYARGERILILSGRRGVAGSLVCGDCGTPVVCAHCASPLALFGPSSELRAPRFFCRHCGTARDSREACTQCTSWNLKALGMGSEGAEEVLRHILPPGATVVRIDSDTAPTDRRAQALLSAAEGARVYVGTEKIMRYLTETDHTVAIGFDAALSLPDFQNGETVLRTLLRARARTKQHMILETRLSDHPVLRTVVTGEVMIAQRDELALRSALSFPPAAILIEIICLGQKLQVQKTLAPIVAQLHEWNPTVIPHSEEGTRGTRVFLRVPLATWPEERLIGYLKTLPPSLFVRVRR